MRTLVVAGALALAALAACTAAWADGDPASDVLYTQNVFLPYARGIPQSLGAKLESAAAAAKKSGNPIKVAVIASRGDLGLVQSLWLQPERYAPFLGRELRFAYHGTLVVVMPSGFGVYRDEKPVGREERLLSRVRIDGSPRGLTEAALVAVRRLSGAGPGSESQGSGWRDRLLIGAGAALVVAALVVLGGIRRRRGASAAVP